MPYGEFVEWVAYSRIQPFGDERADWQAALQASVTVESARGIMRQLSGGKGKRGKPAQPKDFLLKFEKPKVQGWQGQLAFVEMLNVALGGEDKRPTASPESEDEAGR